MAARTSPDDAWVMGAGAQLARHLQPSMLIACYSHLVVMLQVKNLPEDLHAALADRAKAEGVTMSAYVTRLLRVDLQRPTLREWILEQQESDGAPRSIDVVGALEDARADYDS